MIFAVNYNRIKTVIIFRTKIYIKLKICTNKVIINKIIMNCQWKLFTNH